MSSQWLVEPIAEADVPALQDLFRKSGPYVAERGASDYWLYARLFSDTCLGVKENGHLVGALIAFRDQCRNFLEIYIQDVAVSAERRGQGIAATMMAELLRKAATWHVRRVWLTSDKANEAAMRLWRKLGFVNREADYLDGELWVTRDLKGPGRDRVIFEIELPC